MKTFRKYYLPGIISLVGVAIILIVIVYPKEQNLRTLEIIIPSQQNNYLNEINKQVSKRKTNYIFLKAEVDNTSLIDSTFQIIKLVEENKDSINCYSFLNIEKISYGNIVEILDQCQINGLESYWLYEDTFSIYYIPPIVRIKKQTITINPVFKCGYVGPSQAEIEKMEWNFKKHLYRDVFFVNYKKYSIPMAIFYLGMLFFYFILPFIQSKISSK